MKKILVILALFFCNKSFSQFWSIWDDSTIVSNGLLTGLLSYYKLDESSGTFVDSKSAINSTSVTGITYSATGKINTGISMISTTGNGIGFGYQSSFSLTTGSVGGWFNYIGGAYIACNMNADADRNGWALLRNGSNVLFILGNGSSAQNVTSTGTISTSTWYHVVVTWDGSTVKMYINGSLDKTVSQTVTPTFTSFPFTIGTGTGSDGSTKKYPFAGSLDEIFVYNRVLSAADVTQLYNGGSGFAFSNFN